MLTQVCDAILSKMGLADQVEVAHLQEFLSKKRAEDFIDVQCISSLSHYC